MSAADVLRRFGRSWGRVALVVVSTALAAPLAPALDADPAAGSEVRRVQAACLYNFYFYVRGLPSQLEERPFAIGILGDDPFGEHLEAVRDHEVDGRAVQLRRADQPAELENCDVIFVSSSEQHRVEEILRYFQGKPHVLVSDISGFANEGGTVGFVLSDGRVGFEINHRTAKESQLELSSHLLRLAREVLK